MRRTALWQLMVTASVSLTGVGCLRPPPRSGQSQPTAPLAQVGTVWFSEVESDDGGARFVGHGSSAVIVVSATGLALRAPDGNTVELRPSVAGSEPGARLRSPRGEGELGTVVRRLTRTGQRVTRGFASVAVPVRDGVDLVVYGSGNTREFDWRFAPGVRDTPVLDVVGGDVAAQADGSLRIGPVVVSAPHSFTVDADGGRSVVSSAFQLQARSDRTHVAVDVASHAHDELLVADPRVEFIATIGGSGNEQVGNPLRLDRPGLGVGPDGTIYVSGTTTSTDLPVTGNARFPNQLRREDTFVAGLTADGRGIGASQRDLLWPDRRS